MSTENQGEPLITPESSSPEPGEQATRLVKIPAHSEHGGRDALWVRLKWVCPKCGETRGEPHAVISWDGSRRLYCDGWENPCGHVDTYTACRKEAEKQ